MRPMIWAACMAALVLMLLGAAAQAQEGRPAQAQPVQTGAPGQSPTPTAVEDLLRLLGDPSVQAWLVERRGASQPGDAPRTAPASTPATAPASTPATAPAPVAVPPTTAPQTITAPSAAPAPAGPFARAMDSIRHRMAQQAEAAILIPNAFVYIGTTLADELQETGFFTALALIAVFMALGQLSFMVFWRLTAGARTWIVAVPLDTVGQRLRVVFARFAFGLGWIAAYAVGTVGAFLLFEWPLRLSEIVLGVLIVFLGTRLGMSISRFLLAPGAPRFRMVPLNTTAAWFWHRRLSIFTGYVSFILVFGGVIRSLGVWEHVADMLESVFALGVLALAIEMAWRAPPPGHPERSNVVAIRASEDETRAAIAQEQTAPGLAESPADPPADAVPDADADQQTPEHARRRRQVRGWLLTAYFVTLWFMMMINAPFPFAILALALGLPAAIAIQQSAVKHVLRPPGAADADSRIPTVEAVILERGLRALLIAAAALILIETSGLDVRTMTAGDTLWTRLVRGGANALLIVLLADLAWHTAAAMIDRRLALARGNSAIGVLPSDEGGGIASAADPEEARRHARLRTLLPILRNVLMVVVVAMAALMALSALGVEIAPLIAGAGVVGIAVGFGAQTLVKDVMSGVFYLIDDAFRVGEYIQAGSYKGTVESFSLRSVKLRHHRGPLYTVPFGELGAIQNMSRDWVIDKFTLGVTYNTDLEKARKLIKKIGQQLAEDPAFKPHILETLKMQGVEQFGDFSIQIRLKMMTKPGEQFIIRRKAFALIKAAFDANGISFAFPTVQVAGGTTTSDAAVARQAIELAAPQPAAAQ